MIISCLLAVLFVPQAAAQPIDYETRAKSLGAVLRELSSKTGVPLTADADLALEPVIVRIEKVPLNQLLKRLAESVSATVVSTGSGTAITRPAAMRQGLQDVEVRAWRRIIEYQTAQYAKVLKLPWDVPSLTALIRKKLPAVRTGPTTEEQIGPVPRALARCLLDIAPNAIARIPYGQRVVFATSANSLQRPLGQHAQEALKLLTSEQAAWGKALKRVEKNPNTLEEDRDASFFGGYAQNMPPIWHDPWNRSIPFFGTPAKAIVTICNVDWGIYRVNFLMLSKGGQPIFEFEAAETLFRDPKDFRPSTPTNEPTYTYTVPVAFPPSLAWEKVFNSDPPKNESLLAPAREVVAKFFTESTEAEPLALLPSDGVLALARSRGVNVVACLPDGFADCFELMKDGKVSLGIMESYLKDESVVVDRSDKSWLVIRPVDPILSHLKRPNRQAFQRLMRSVAAAKRVTIEDYARFYGSAGLMPAYTFGHVEVLTAFNVYFPQVGNQDLIAFYAALTPDQRATLATGGDIRYGGLSQKQQAAAQRVIYGPAQGVNGTIRYEQNLPQVYEPTEAMPSGPLQDARIRAPLKQDRIVTFVDLSDPKHRQFWQEDIDLPPISFMSGPGPLPPKRGQADTGYVVSSQARVALEIEARKGEFIGLNIAEYSLTNPSKLLKLEELPADARERVVQAWKLLKGFRR